MKITFFLLFVGLFLSCASIGNEKDVKISGELKSLPDGVMYLFDENRNLIDSVNSKNGVFEFKISSQNQKPSPFGYGMLEHRDLKNIKRLFSFITSRKYRNAPLQVSTFILENGLRITGSLEEETLESIKLPDSIKFVHPSNPIKGGKQTWVMHNVDFDFSQMPADSSITRVKAIIKKYPYSYYLLHEFKKYKNNYSAMQLTELLSLFDKDLLAHTDVSPIKQTIKIKERGDEVMIKTKFVPLNQGDNPYVSTPKAKVNMIILWASWCSPCIKEIPDLNVIYNQYKTHDLFGMVSVSVDQDKGNWLSAIQKHKLPWRQLWIPENLTAVQQTIFQYDGSIPCVLFVNEKGKLIQKIIGYNENNIDEYKKIIDSVLKTIVP